MGLAGLCGFAGAVWIFPYLNNRIVILLNGWIALGDSE